MAKKEILISTREVRTEIERQSISLQLQDWVKSHHALFRIPTLSEQMFVAKIFKIKHFQGLIGTKQQLHGTPVADPFVVACAKVHAATVVTEEGWQHRSLKPVPKQNAAKIPNVCQHFKIPCLNLEEFMHQQKWVF